MLDGFKGIVCIEVNRWSKGSHFDIISPMVEVSGHSIDEIRLVGGSKDG